MTHCNPLYDDMEALAAQKSFGDLTPEERTAVLRSLGSADAYTGLRATVLRIRAGLAADAPRLEPRAATRDSLRRVVEQRARHSAPLPFSRRCLAMVHRRIPAYYAAAAMVAAVAVMAVLYRPTTPQPQIVREVVYVERQAPAQQAMAVQDDTPTAVPTVVPPAKPPVLRTHKTPVAHTAEAGSVIRDTAREAVASVIRMTSTSLPGFPRNVFIGLGNLPQLDVQSRGRTLAEDSSLSRFVRPMSDDTL